LKTFLEFSLLKKTTKLQNFATKNKTKNIVALGGGGGGLVGGTHPLFS